MDQKQFEEACGNTLLLVKQNTPDEQLPADARRMPEDPSHPAHLKWMLIQAALFHFENRTEKANRWLGFVQGVIAAQKGASLEELKRANMPEGAEFSSERV